MAEYKKGDKAIVIQKVHPLYKQLVTVTEVYELGGLRAQLSKDTYRFAFHPMHLIPATPAARILYKK